MSGKEFVDAGDLVRNSFALARKVYDSGFRPDVLLVLWRGGTPVGIVVHEFLLYKGIETYHAAVKAESYTGIEKRVEPRVEQLDPVLARIEPGQKVLIIDDIFDTGYTMQKVCALLEPKTTDVKIATLYYKPQNNRTGLSPDFYMRSSDRWIVFPHELMDLSPHEIRQKDAVLADLLG